MFFLLTGSLAPIVVPMWMACERMFGDAQELSPEECHGFSSDAGCDMSSGAACDLGSVRLHEWSLEFFFGGGGGGCDDYAKCMCE